MRYVLILSMLMLVGCKSRQLSHAPAQGHAYPGRTTVFGSADSPYRMDEPWYAARNDAKLTVAAGVQSPTVQHSATRTYDRTHSYDGRVQDHYYRTRVNVRYRSTTQ